MLLNDVARASLDVAQTSSRNAKIARLAALLADASPADARIVVNWLSGTLPQGRIGIGPAALRDARTTPAAEPSLTVHETDAVLDEIAAVSGNGAARTRVEFLSRLMARAAHAEQDFLVRLVYGELRQGALESVLADAVARAASIAAADIRRAAQLTGDLPTVAEAALRGGADAVAAFGVQLFRPL